MFNKLKMKKCIVVGNLFRISKGQRIGLPDKKLRDCQGLLIATKQKDIYEVHIPFHLKKGETFATAGAVPKGLGIMLLSDYKKAQKELENDAPENDAPETSNAPKVKRNA